MKRVANDRMPHYRDRADTLFRTMSLIEGDIAYEEAVPLLAVHSAIALADAILVACTGQRGSDPNHRETIRALENLCTSRRRGRDGLQHLSWLLGNKTDLIYGDRTLDPNTHIKAARLHSERFIAWAYKTFPEIARQE